MARETRGPQFVVIGASAGGIGALSTLVASLPPGLPAPIVIAQHLDPARPSHMGELLSRHTTLPVRVLSNHPTLPLEPGAIFVIPSNRHVRVTEHELAVEEDGGERPKPSIDLLLSGAAAVYGEGLIAVILTGRGTDGAAGARAVKAAGGMVIIQNPATAAFPSMPDAVDPTMVDIVTSLEGIGALLHALLTGDALPSTTPTEHALAAFLEEVRARGGIDFGKYRPPTIRRRLERRLAAVGATSLAAYQLYLQNHPEEYERLINSFLIKVTEFFRDPELYDFLRQNVLPDLIARAREQGRPLRVWSAGCATGQEAYSLGILFAEALGDDLQRADLRIFATDLDAAAITVARRGLYLPADLAAVPADLVARYFTPVDGAYVVAKHIRALTVFGEHDLAQRAPFPNIDLCVCRNVLIYFTPELQAHTLRLFAFAVRDSGYLVLGKAETPRTVDDLFRQVTPLVKVYRRQGERLPLAGSSTLPDQFGPYPHHAGGRPSRRLALPLERSTARRMAGGLLALPAGVVVVDQHYHVQVINNAARRLLGIHRAAVGEDLIHLLPGDVAVELRAAIDATFHPDPPDPPPGPLPGTPRADRVLTIHSPGGEILYLHVACYAHMGVPGEGPPESPDGPTVVVVIVDVTRTEGQRRRREEDEARARQAAGQQQELARLTAALEDLRATNRQQLAANLEMSEINATLRDQHEEALLRMEEAQAATEEVETLNEELQASNEELETLNEELQASNEELNTTNGELQARTVELIEQTILVNEQRHVAEAEQARLEAVLAALADAVLLVDPQGAVVMTNAAYARLFGPSGLGPLEDAAGEPLPDDADPSRRAARGETFNVTFTLDTAGGRRWFEAVGRPVLQEGVLRWGVVVIRNITGRTLHRLQDEFLATTSHELQTPLTAVRAGLGLLDTTIGPSLQAPERELMETMRRNVERLHHSIDSLLTALAPRTALPQIDGPLRFAQGAIDLRVPVTAAVAVVQPLVHEKGQPLALDLPVALPVVGDPRLLERIAINLLSNAHRHTPPGTQISVAGRVDGDEVRLEVRDTGPGISAAEQATIFGRWSQVEGSTEGAGLGLAIARDATVLHGGRLWVESTAGQGAVFHLALPRADPDAESAGS